MVEGQDVERLVVPDVHRLPGVAFRRSPVAAVAPDQRVGRTIVMQRGFVRRLQLGDDPARERLAKLHSPLIERVDRPYRALGEHAVLVERHQTAQGARIESPAQDHVGRPVALGDTERRLERRRAFGRKLLGGLAECQRLGLREQVRCQQVVLRGVRTQRLDEADEIAGDKLRSLMDELIE